MGSPARHLPADAAFARALRAARRTAGITQQTLAERAGVPVGLVAGSEQGQRRVSIGEAAALAAALGVTLDEMVAGPVEPVQRAPVGRPAKP